MPETFAERALDCLGWICGNVFPDQDSLPQDQAAIVSGLTSMMHTASFIERASRAALHTGNISILLCAKASQPEVDGDSQSGSTSRNLVTTFTLWGRAREEENNTDTDAFRRDGSTDLSPEKGSAVPALELSTRTMFGSEEASDAANQASLRSGKNKNPSKRRIDTLQASGDHRTGSIDAPGLQQQDRKPRGAGLCSNSVHDSPVLQHVDPQNDAIYAIPDLIAAQCTSMLLDGSGHRTHPMFGKEPGYDEIHVADIKDVVSTMHKYESDMLKRPGSAESEVQESENQREELPSSTNSVSDEKELLYAALTPDSLRLREVIVPFVRLCRRSSSTDYSALDFYEVFNKKTMRLDMRKPCRNTKEKNFGILCVHLHFYGMKGSAGRALSEFASRGIKLFDSCSLWRRHTKASQGKGKRSARVTHAGMSVISANEDKTMCGGPASCAQKPKRTCKFIVHSGSQIIDIGDGTVHPRATFLGGGRIPPDHVLVRFANVMVAESVRSSLGIDEDTLRKFKTEVVLWKKSGIKRVSLMGPYSDTIGTAVLVHDNPWEEEKNSKSVRQRGSSVGGTNTSKQLRNAVVLCDVRLKDNEANGDLPYPYAEWYNLPSLKHLIASHFADKKVPNTFFETTEMQVIEILWDRTNVDL